MRVWCGRNWCGLHAQFVRRCSLSSRCAPHVGDAPMPRQTPMYNSYRPEKVRLHVVVLRAFALGAVSLACAAVLLLLPSWHTSASRVALYTLAQCAFHLLEFLSTALFNTSETEDDSFILGDSDLHVAFVCSVVETVAVRHFVPRSTISLYLGLAILVVGQLCRTVSMYTAGASFNHYIQRDKADTHRLVTGGIYRRLRHPSYFGYFWWFIGSQLVLENWLVAGMGVYRLQRFFAARIQYEEGILVSFFGNDYRNYRAKTRVGIPFIG